jgi:hypothetical protein
MPLRVFSHAPPSREGATSGVWDLAGPSLRERCSCWRTTAPEPISPRPRQ